MEGKSLNVLTLCKTKRLANKTGSKGSTSDLKWMVCVLFKTETILIVIYPGSIQSLRMSVGISPWNQPRSLPHFTDWNRPLFGYRRLCRSAGFRRPPFCKLYENGSW